MSVMGCVASTPEAKKSSDIDKKIRDDRKKLHEEIKILLLGPGESGKSTIFKQMKIIQDHGGYSREELLEHKYIIYGNCISQMKILVEAAQAMNITVTNHENLTRFNRLLNMPQGGGGDAWSVEMASDIKALWADQGMRNVYGMCDKQYQLNDSANYFFENVDRFTSDTYVPTLDDILRVRVRTTGIQEASFKFEDVKIKMLDVGGQRSERRKWIHCFNEVTVVMFCVSLSEYDQVLREDPNQNRMKESLLLFDEVCNSVWFKKTAFILFLNKTDLFKEKISRVDLTTCFPNYTGGRNFEAAADYLRRKFVQQNRTQHQIYVHFTCAINTENIEFVFKCVRDTVLKQILEDLVVF